MPILKSIERILFRSEPVKFLVQGTIVPESELSDKQLETIIASLNQHKGELENKLNSFLINSLTQKYQLKKEHLNIKADISFSKGSIDYTILIELWNQAHPAIIHMAELGGAIQLIILIKKAVKKVLPPFISAVSDVTAKTIDVSISLLAQSFMHPTLLTIFSLLLGPLALVGLAILVFLDQMRL